MELDRQNSDLGYCYIEETKSTVMLFQLTVPQQGSQCSLNPKGETLTHAYRDGSTRCDVKLFPRVRDSGKAYGC